MDCEMPAIITSIARVKEAASPEGFALFCKENDIDPENPVEREEGFLIDQMDLVRYDMRKERARLKDSISEIVGDLT